MPVAPTYPGVYIEEIPSGVRTITGVATSVAAFIGFFRRGPMNEATQIFNLGDFEREFGGLHAESEAGYGIQQFFRNGGTEAWVVRTASGTPASSQAILLSDALPGGSLALTVTAANPGVWGDGLRVSIDYPAPASGDQFNMTVSLTERRNGRTVVLQSEVFRGLSMDDADNRFVETVVNDDRSGSKLVSVTANGNARPLQTGTLSGMLDPFPAAITNAAPQMSVTIGTEGTGVAALGRRPTSLAEARSLLEAAIRAARPELRAFSEAAVSIVDNRLRIQAGPTDANSLITFATAGTDPTATDLGLLAGTNLEAVISDAFPAGPLAGGKLQVTIGGSTATLKLVAMPKRDTARGVLEEAIRKASGVAAADADGFAYARVVAYDDTAAATEHLIVLTGSAGLAVSFAEAPGDKTATDLGLDAAVSTPSTALVSNDLTPVPSIAINAEADVTIGGNGPHSAVFPAAAATLTGIATQLQAAISAANPGAPTFDGAIVAAYSFNGENRLVALPGNPGDAIVFADTPLDNSTVAELLLNGGNAQANVQIYALGGAAAGAQGAGTPGNDGDPPDAAALIGDLNAQTGIQALEPVDIFNILCIPRTAVLPDPQASAVIQFARIYCERRRAFYIVDTPEGIDEVQEVKDWLDTNANFRHRNAALYFPRPLIPDPLNDFRLRSVGSSGTMAGLYARTDATRGVWKAPAGTEATLRNVSELEIELTDPQNGTLNPLGINCLRRFPIYGNVCWGARTLDGSDQQASEWKYVSVRRLALFLEESLYRGTQWVVFEPNDEPLWAQIRLNAGAFMHNLFRQGAFQGSTPRQAYLVKCDSETTTQNDINLGRVNILVGFAPLKPAEFVIIQIQQLAGQIEA